MAAPLTAFGAGAAATPLITEQWTKETHQGFLSMVRSHWRGWNIVLFEDRASQHTAPDSRAWADELLGSSIDVSGGIDRLLKV